MNFKLKAFLVIFFSGVLLTGQAMAEILPEDCKTVVKITKKLNKLSNNNKLDELAAYYSDSYKSFDGYNKNSVMKIHKLANKLYPKTKSREKITNVETKDDLIKVFVDETSKTKMVLKGEDTKYSNKEKIKGKMNSTSSYALIFAKENGLWKIVSDEIYKETTEIEYGEAINAEFSMDVPEKITPGGDYCVKAVLKLPKNRFVVGSIGHDKIVFPPERYIDPFRAMDKDGVLERVMVANKEGLNEYANSTFTFIAPVKANKKENPNAAISGMGIYVKRINTIKDSL